MKKVFYKKVLPIALAASMTVTALSGAISASAVQSFSSVSAASNVRAGVPTSGTVSEYTQYDPVQFDYFDNDNSTSTFTLKFLAGAELEGVELNKLTIAKPTAAGTPVSGVTIEKLEIGTEKTIEVEVDGEKQTQSLGFEYTLTASVLGSASEMEGVDLIYNGTTPIASSSTNTSKNTFDFKVARTAKTGYTTYNDTTGEFTKYEKSLPVVDLTKLTGVKVIGSGTANVFTKGGDVKSVIFPASVTDIKANAFSGCKNLSYIEVDSGNANKTIKVLDTTFANVLKTVPVVVKGSGTVTFEDSEDKAINYTDVDELSTNQQDYSEAGTKLICQLNDVVKFNPSYVSVGAQKVLVTQSTSDTTGSLKATKDAGNLNYAPASGVSDWSAVKWGIYKKGAAGSSPVGKFLVNGKYNGATVTGKNDNEMIFLKAVKADGAFNGVAEVRGTISVKNEADKKNYDCVVASFEICVEPQWVSGYKNLAKDNAAYAKAFEKDNDTDKKFKLTPFETNGTTIPENKYEPASKYKLEIYEGQSFKLPFAAKDGANKTLAYDVQTDLTDSANPDYSKGFTVIGGTVKALYAASAAGTTKNGTIEVYPVDKGHNTQVPGAKIEVDVYVKPAVKALRVNTSTLALVPKKSVTKQDPNYATQTITELEPQWQRFTVSANPVTKGDITVDITGIPDNVKIRKVGTLTDLTVNAGKAQATINGAAEFEVAFDSATAGTADGKLTITPAAVGTVKAAKAVTVILKMKNKTVFDNVKSIKQTGKMNAAKDAIELNVPLGSSYNLGVSVNPATADNDIRYTVKKDSTAASASTYMVGDVFVASDLGEFEITAETGAHSEKMGTVSTAVPYKIHVYNPGGNIVWEDYSKPDLSGTGYDYVGTVIRGGFLVKDDAETIKTIESNGKVITIKAPVLTGKNAGGEEIVWTSSNPAGLNVQKTAVGTGLELRPLVAGTYTVSGVSTITKQKFSFKVLVGSNLTADNKDLAQAAATLNYIAPSGRGSAYTVGEVKTLKVGETLQAYLDTSGASSGYTADKISYTVDTANKKNITVKNGLIKAVGVTGDTNATVTFKMENKVKSTTDPKYASVSLVMTIKVVPAEPVITVKTPETSITKGGKVNPKSFITYVDKSKCFDKWMMVKLTAAGGKDTSEAAEMPAKIENAGMYLIYPLFKNCTNTNAYSASGDVLPKGVKVKVYENAPKSIAIAGPAASSNYSGSNYAFNGTALTIDKDETGITIPLSVTPAVKDANVDVDDIVWTSNNVNIATVSSTVGTGNSYYANVTVTPKHVAGKVVLTGLSKNGNKKIAITITVTDDKSKVDKFDTTSFHWDNANTTITKSFAKAKDTKLTFNLTAEYTQGDFIWTKDTAKTFFKLAVKDSSGTAITENVPFKITNAVWGAADAQTGKRTVTLTVEYAKPASFSTATSYKLTPSYNYGGSAPDYTVTINPFSATPTFEASKFAWKNDAITLDLKDGKSIIVPAEYVSDNRATVNSFITPSDIKVELLKKGDTAYTNYNLSGVNVGEPANNKCPVETRVMLTGEDVAKDDVFTIQLSCHGKKSETITVTVTDSSQQTP